MAKKRRCQVFWWLITLLALSNLKLILRYFKIIPFASPLILKYGNIHHWKEGEGREVTSFKKLTPFHPLFSSFSSSKSTLKKTLIFLFIYLMLSNLLIGGLCMYMDPCFFCCYLGYIYLLPCNVMIYKFMFLFLLTALWLDRRMSSSSAAATKPSMFFSSNSFRLHLICFKPFFAFPFCWWCCFCCNASPSFWPSLAAFAAATRKEAP